MKRYFNSRQKLAALFIQQFKCAVCHTPIGMSAHAHHKHHYSDGGSTTITNLAMLCPDCHIQIHRRKQTMFLRPHQQIVASEFTKKLGSPNKVYTINHVPGSGKTITAITAIKYSNMPAVIVVPSPDLYSQFIQAAANFNIDLTDNIKGARHGSIFWHGVITTYQALASNGITSQLIEAWLNNRPYIMIFDEVHHLSETIYDTGTTKKSSWAASLDQLTKHSSGILAMTGTLFRSDGNAIPFLSYTPDGNVKSDHDYTDYDSIKDGHVLPIDFNGVKPRGITLKDGSAYATINEAEEANGRRYIRDALSREETCMEILKPAFKQLKAAQAIHKDAALIVAAMDVQHQKMLEALIKNSFQVSPVVVNSGDSSAKYRLEDFKKNTEPVLLVVGMAGEGYDCPRLKVGAYLSNVSTKLKFRQFAGRTCRLYKKFQNATVFYVDYMPSITDAVEEYKADTKTLKDKPEKNREQDNTPDGIDAPDLESINHFEYTAHDYERVYPPEVIAETDKLRAAGIHCSHRQTLKYLSDKGITIDMPPKNEIVKKLKEANSKRVNTIVMNMKYPKDFKNSKGKSPYSALNIAANKHIGCKTVEEATIDQLETRLNYLHSLNPDKVRAIIEV